MNDSSKINTVVGQSLDFLVFEDYIDKVFQQTFEFFLSFLDLFNQIQPF